MDRNLRIRMLLEAGDRVTQPLRSIAGGSTAAARALRATRDELAGIGRTQRDIADFRQLKAGLRTADQALAASRARTAQLAQAMRATANPTRAMTRAFESARAATRRLEDQQEGEARRLQQLRDRLRAAGIETNALARHERELRDRAASTTRTLADQERQVTRLAERQRRLSAARERFDRIQSRAVGLAAGGAAAIGTGMAIARPMMAGVRAAQEYGSVMTDIAQKANLGRIEAEKMGAGLLVAARAANQLPDQLQAGVDTLSGFGLDPRQAVAMMRPIGRAATAYKAEIADLSAAAFAANDNLKVPVTQTARVIDIMAAAGKAGAFEVRDMAGAFPALTAAYQALGQTGTGAVADLAAALQIARKGAGDSATTATNIANVIQKIASPLTIKNFAKFGIDLPKALKRAYAEGKTPLEAIAELTERATKGDLGRIGFLFEDAQVQQGLRPLIQNMREYRDIRRQAAAASGTTDRDFAERMQDSAEQSKALAVNARVLGITLGTMLLPTVNRVVQRATALATWIGDAAARYPNLTRAVLVGTAAFAGLFLVLGGGAVVVAGLVAPVAALAFASTALNIAMLPLTGIVLGVVAAVVAAGMAAYYLKTHWGDVAGFFGRMWTTIKARFWAEVDGLRRGAGQMVAVGRMLIMGLVDGLNPMPAIRRIIGVGDQLVGAIRRRLGIRSPSRVFAGLGGHIVDGLSVGIRAQEGEPVQRMTALSRRLSAAIVTSATTPALAMAGPGGGSGAIPPGAGAAPGSVYHITIQQQPGQDAEALARAVTDELDRRERAGAARARSAYADPEDF